MRALLSLALLAPTFASANLQVSGSATNPSCGNSDGQINIYVSGGTTPYSYAWDDGPTIASRSGLAAGYYHLTVTDFVGTIVTYGATLTAGTMQLPGTTYAGGFPCAGQANGSFIVVNSQSPGVPPYTTNLTVNGIPWSSSGVNSWGDPVYSGVARDDQVSYSVTDANGCVGYFSFFVEGPLGNPAAQLDNTPACGTDGGSITLVPDFSDWPVDLSVYNNVFQLMGQTYQDVLPMTLTDLAPGDYTVIQGYTFGFLNGCPAMVGGFTIGDLGPNCGTVSGTSWYDVDADCTQDAGEVPIPYSPLLIQPGNLNVLTNGAGHYSFPIVNGSYTLAQSDPTLVSICPGTMPAPFTMNTNAQSVPLANGSTEPLDLAVYAAQCPARPGFVYEYWGTVRNVSPQVSGAVTVTATFDASLTYVNALPAPSSVVGNVVTWNLPAFGSFHEAYVAVMLSVPVGMPLGTVLTNSLAATNTLPDANATNDSVTLSITVQGSYDPNDKTARTSTGSSDTQYFIGDDEWLDYTIRFQNTGTDTAFTVVVTDVIDADLDMSTFEQGTASNAFDVAFKPGRVVEWRFDNILLPDSGTNEAASHGLVNFRIKPKQPLLPGTVLSNAADIFFDLNAPIHTNDAVVVVESSTGMTVESGHHSTLFPNPVTDGIVIVTQGPPPTSVRIIGTDGREVLRTIDRSTVDVQALRPGLYVALLRWNDGRSEALPFMKE